MIKLFLFITIFTHTSPHHTTTIINNIILFVTVARVLGRRGVTHRRHVTAIAHRRLAAITTADSSLHLHHSLTNLFLSLICNQ